MLVQHLDPLASSLFSLLAIASLLAVVCDARLALAEELPLCLCRRELGDRGAVGGGRLLRRLSRTLSDRHSDLAVSRAAAAVPDLADHPPARCRPRDSRDSATGTSLVVGALCVMFALAVSYRVAAEFHLELIGRGPGADRHAVDEADRLSDAGGPPRGDQPGSRSARARKRHLSRLADPGAGDAAADRDGDPVRPADRRRVLRRARRLSVDPCRDHQHPRARSGWWADGRRAACSHSRWRRSRRRSGCLVLRGRPRLCEALNLVASAIAFACAAAAAVSGRRTGACCIWDDYVMVDRAAAWVVLCTAIVYLLASIYAVGYMRLLERGSSGCSGFMRCLRGLG